MTRLLLVSEAQLLLPWGLPCSHAKHSSGGQVLLCLNTRSPLLCPAYANSNLTQPP